jgi:hypothetical protein
LLAALDGTEVPEPRQHLPLELVVRGTTAPPSVGAEQQEPRTQGTRPDKRTDGMMGQVFTDVVRRRSS